MRFTQITPTLANHWRAVILFGRNVASYKFALAKSLLEPKSRSEDLISLGDLAEPFSRHLCEHLELTDRQTTSGSSRFLDQCRRFNSGEISKNELVEVTVRLGFNNVIDAFHIVQHREIPERFFIDERRSHGRIRLTDNLFRLKENSQNQNIGEEVESRWRLVETAWDLGISRNLLCVEKDQETNSLFVANGKRRVDVTSARSALNGYQKGVCFYCNQEIQLIGSEIDKPADIDHFFPWTIEVQNKAIGLNGVWNLVLACVDCNRGSQGKFDRIPKLDPYLYRLEARNNYLIESHHPLRETLIRQTGRTLKERHGFLQAQYDRARQCLIHSWEPPLRATTVHL